MMNTIKGGALCLAFCLMLVKLSYADGSLFGHGDEDKTLFVVVEGVSGVVTKITADNRILGYSVMGSANAIAGFYDNGTFFAEGGSLANSMETLWFPMPKDMDGNLWVQVNASTTIVTIYYE